MATATAGIGAIAGLAQTFKGAKMQRDAQRSIDNFKWQELSNPYKALQVSTLGADRQLSQLGTYTASAIDALRRGGQRGLLGGLPSLGKQTLDETGKITADLDAQQKQLDILGAQGEEKIRQMTEERQQNELAGYGNQLSTGMGIQQQGLGSLIGAGTVFANMGGSDPLGKLLGIGQQSSGTNMFSNMMGGMSDKINLSNTARVGQPQQDAFDFKPKLGMLSNIFKPF